MASGRQQVGAAIIAPVAVWSISLRVIAERRTSASCGPW